MADQILDGRGRGFRAEVSSEYQLMTKSVQIERIAHQSITYGNAYFIEYLFKQQTGDVMEFMGYTTYTGVNNLVLEQIHLVTRDPDYTHFDLYVGTYLPTGGAIGTTINWNTTSSKTPAIGTYHQNDGGSLISATANGILAFTTSIKGQGVYVLDLRSAFVVRPQLTLSIKCACKTANSLTRAFVSFFELDSALR